MVISSRTRLPVNQPYEKSRQTMVKWVWVKNRYPEWNPSKWQQRLKPAVPWRFNIDPYPCVCASLFFGWSNRFGLTWAPKGNQRGSRSSRPSHGPKWISVTKSGANSKKDTPNWKINSRVDRRQVQYSFQPSWASTSPRLRFGRRFQ